MNIPIIAGASLILFSFYFLFYAIRNYKRAIASGSWPSVKGRLEEVKLWGKRRVGDEMLDVDHLSIKYQYEVEGKEYVGAKVAFYTLVYPETSDFTKIHSEGIFVSVYYDPLKPDYSVLITGPKKSKRYSEIILSCLGIVAGALVITLNL